MPKKCEGRETEFNPIGCVESVDPVLHFMDLLYDHAQKWPVSAWMFMESFEIDMRASFDMACISLNGQG